ncbi:MAG: 4-hydroxy-tetrahydrodipicolinate reductase [Clostridiales bacterium]|jgi:4-hydroxy-tetrahydrodipicolinate reductase|nr:4-hydroxy-tetrahydrodipicolinate reductase [Clostridiales bacterium]
MIKVLIFGISGKMGHMIYSQLQNHEKLKVVAGIDKYAEKIDFNVPVFPSIKDCAVTADVIIDFSRPDSLADILPYAADNKIPLVIATTGHTPEQTEQISRASKAIPIFMTSNMSLGINLLISLSKQAASFLGSGFDVEIVEQHHNQKADSPSGTALSIARSLNDVFSQNKEFIYGRCGNASKRRQSEIGIHAVRGGTIVGKHDVMFIGNDEVITIAHEAQSRQVFAAGAIRAAEYIIGKKPKVYNMNNLLGLDYSVTNVSAENDVTVFNIPNTRLPEYVKLLDLFAKENINIDMISQIYNPNESVSLSFTVKDKKAVRSKDILEALKIKYSAVTDTAKITCEGAGMEYQSGVFKDIVNILKGINAKIYLITTGKTQISCCIDSASLNEAEKLLNDYYIK